MKITFFTLTSLFALSCGFLTGKNTISTMGIQDGINITEITVNDMNGNEVKLSDYNGKVLLIVNVASKCGYTKQYAGLQALYEKYKDQGFEILAFPCNDFGGQEPGTNEDIVTFCQTNFNVNFPLFDKITVKGDDKEPLYAKLIQYPPADDISWNFEKFVIDKDGNVVGRFKSKVTPESGEISSLIESELAK